MSVYERIQVLLDETFSIYNIAAFDGSLFVVFALFCLFLLVSGRRSDIRARDGLAIPSLFIMLFVMNPVIVHYLLKHLSFARVARLFWAFPFELVILYCLTEAVWHFRERWKKLLICVCVPALLFWGAHCEILQHLSIATNPYKVPDYTIELTELINSQKDEQRPTVAAPSGVQHWFRQYDTDIVICYGREGDDPFKSAINADTVDLDLIGGVLAPAYGCDFIILDATAPSAGSLEDYGYIPAGSVDNYAVYKYCG